MSKTITVIGFGNVGRVLVNLLLGSDHSMRLNIVDPADRLSGIFLDLEHALGMQPDKRVYFNDQKLFEASDFVFFTAGCLSKHGTSRLTTVKENTKLVKDVFFGKELNDEMYVIAITNPVDVVTAAIVKYSGLPDNQVMGTGTYLDSQRFSYHLAQLARVDYRDVNALMLGEHGESCAPILSRSYFKDEPILKSKLFQAEITDKALYKTRHAAFEIRKTEPGTSIAVSHCAIRTMECLMDDEEHRLPLSVLLNEAWTNHLELTHPICISVPVVLSSKGLKIPEPLQLKKGELSALKRSAQMLLDYQGFLED